MTNPYSMRPNFPRGLDVLEDRSNFFSGGIHPSADELSMFMRISVLSAAVGARDLV